MLRLKCWQPNVSPSMTSVHGTKPKYRKLVAMSAPEGIADENCSARAFLVLDLLQTTSPGEPAAASEGH